MKACHLVYSYFPFDPRVRKEVDTLRKLGHSIDVIATRDAREPREETIRGVPVRRVPVPVVRGGKARYGFQYALFFLLASALLLSLHLRRRYEIVHVHSLPDFQVFGALPAKLLGARVVLDLHEALPEIVAARFRLSMSSPLVRIAQALEWMSCAVADTVLVVNDVIRDRIIGRGVDPAKVTVVMNTPDPDLFVLRDTDRRRSELGLANQKAIVYVGGINQERDLALLVRAAARVRKSCDLKLFIFGYGSSVYRNQLTEIAKQEGFDGHFLLGPQIPAEDVFSYISLSEVGPVTYERNPLTEVAVPNKVFEYAAAHKPLVIADLPALRSVFGDTALYYVPGDVDDLARKIESLFADPALGARLAKQADGVLNGCSWTVMSDRLQRIYANSGAAGGG